MRSYSRVRISYNLDVCRRTIEMLELLTFHEERSHEWDMIWVFASSIWMINNRLSQLFKVYKNVWRYYFHDYTSSSRCIFTIDSWFDVLFFDSEDLEKQFQWSCVALRRIRKYETIVPITIIIAISRIYIISYQNIFFLSSFSAYFWRYWIIEIEEQIVFSKNCVYYFYKWKNDPLWDVSVLDDFMIFFWGNLKKKWISLWSAKSDLLFKVSFVIISWSFSSRIYFHFFFCDLSSH